MHVHEVAWVTVEHLSISCIFCSITSGIGRGLTAMNYFITVSDTLVTSRTPNTKDLAAKCLDSRAKQFFILQVDIISLIKINTLELRERLIIIV